LDKDEIFMRQSQQKNRMRGRGRKQPNPMSRSFESNGPDVKIRGNASHIAEKYTQLARDALSSGDTVMAENYLQHAEHYNRIIAAAAANSVREGEFSTNQRIQPEFGGQAFDDEDEDEGDDMRPAGERRIPEARQASGDDRPQPRERDEGRNRGEYRNDNRPRQDFRDRNDGRDRNEFRDRGENRDRSEFRDRGESREPRADNRERPEMREPREPRQIPIETRNQAETGEPAEGLRQRRDMRNRRPRPALDQSEGMNGSGGNGRERPAIAAVPVSGISSDAAKLPGSLFGAGPEPIAGSAGDE
jgi:hypothetical protein